MKKHRIYHPDARVTLGVVLESIREDNQPFAFPVRPERLSIFRNGYSEADTFSVSFSASHLPLVPDAIRACSVEIYLFNKPTLSEQPESITKGDDSSLWIDGDEIKPAIIGLCDEPSMDLDDSGRMITLTGRDYTALYLDQQWDTRFRVTYKGPLDTVIQKLADNVPSSNGIMRVKTILPDGETLPIVGEHETRASRRGLTFPSKANFWEVMLSIAVRYGFILFIKGTDIILTTPKVYKAGKTGVKKMAWGQNLTSIHASRKLGRERVPSIECVSWDEQKQQVVRAVYPPTKKGSKKKRKSGQNANGLGGQTNEIEQHTIPGITSHKVLLNVAEQIWHKRGISEMTVQFTTNDLTDLEDELLLDISSGDAIALQFDSFNEEEISERIVAKMVARGYDADVAAKLGQSIELMNSLRQPLRVDSATIDYAANEGMSITIAAQQFVNIDVQGEEP